MKLLKSLGILAVSLTITLAQQGTVHADETSPKALYLTYLKTLSAAKKVDEIMPFLCKHSIEQIKSTPEPDRAKMFEFMKMFRPVDVAVVSETIDGEKANLKLTAKVAEDAGKNVKDTTVGKVDLVREGSEWKIEKESYDSKIENIDSPSGSSAGMPPSALDAKKGAGSEPGSSK